MLSRYYEEIFPLQQGALDFILREDLSGQSVLDAGCGTGSLVRALRRKGVDALGFDLDGDMVAQASSLADEDDIFRTGDLTRLDEVFPGRRFGLISCIGNTLVHLPRDVVGEVLSKAYILLEDRGSLVLQILNYRNFLEKGQVFPEIRTGNCLFRRSYRPGGREGELRFVTVLEELRSGELRENTTVLYPLMPEELEQLVLKAGFSRVDLYGSWKKDPPGEGQMPLILRAEKG